ncbi:MAG: sigma-70 family RNA polymerase sigma factor, partial [Candidatus Limnocylindrales bacterium]
MIELAGVQPRDDDRVVEMLPAGVPEAHRLASAVLRDPVGAEDAVQEALLRAWSRRRSIRFELGEPQRWFMRIVVNVCRHELRRKRRQPVAAIDPGVTATEAGSSPPARDDLDLAIGRLTDDEQIVLALRFGRDLTIPHIASQLALPEGTVKSRLHYALEHVRAALDRGASGGGATTMSVPDLETRIRAYYDKFQPDDSTHLVLASQKQLEDARRPRQRGPLWGSLRLAAVLAVAVIFLAVLFLPRGGTVGPGSGTNSPGPTFNLPAALDAQVDQAGLMRTGGIWAVQGWYFLTSTDNGATWRAGTFPSPGGLVAVEQVFVLDQDHAWAITSNGMNGGLASPTVPRQMFEMNRTTDGGRTWQTASVSGDFRCDTASISFVDADHGFVMCSYASTPGPNGQNNEVRTQAKKGAGTVLRTNDGGATWSVAGGATGLGSQFTASDATTLWSAPDYTSSGLTGPTLSVSRDAGATWSTVSLPEMYTGFIPGPVEVGVDSGPIFWDANDGALAVDVYVAGTSSPPAVWFYRTEDAGRSWTLTKKPAYLPPMAGPDALVGKEWVVVGTNANGFFGLSESSDFGATWTDVPGFGMPPNTAFISLDFADRDHAIATVFVGPGSRALMQSSDGGRTWHAADFGNARAMVSSKSADPAAASNLAGDYETMAIKDPPTAWNLLSSYSQRAFGSEAAFEAAETTLAKRTGYTGPQLGAPTQSLDVLSKA